MNRTLWEPTENYVYSSFYVLIRSRGLNTMIEVSSAPPSCSLAHMPRAKCMLAFGVAESCVKTRLLQPRFLS